MVGGAIIVAWIVGLALLVRREYFRPQLERLAEAATPRRAGRGVLRRDAGRPPGRLRVVDARYGRAVDHRSTTISSPICRSAARRVARRRARTCTLSRALHMSSFDLTLDAEGAPMRAERRVDGDSVLVLAVQTGRRSRTRSASRSRGRFSCRRSCRSRSRLGEHPKVGKHYVLPVFDPATMAPKDVGVDVRAESSFVVNDSSVFDSATPRWRGVRPDTIRAWQVVTRDRRWIQRLDRRARADRRDDAARASTLRRMPYEVAFENWRTDSGTSPCPTTATFSRRRRSRRTSEWPARRRRSAFGFSNVALAGFDLNGQRQRSTGDTLTIGPQPDSALAHATRLPPAARPNARRHTPRADATEQRPANRRARAADRRTRARPAGRRRATQRVGARLDQRPRHVWRPKRAPGAPDAHGRL